MRKIGLMGGTFNPIHMGHLLLAQWAMEEQGLEEVWLIPTGCSYMKLSTADMVSPWERYEMTCLAIDGNPRMKCLDIEIRREGYTYTYETLLELSKEYPDCQFYFIFGADCLYSIENWKQPEVIFKHCNIIAALRGDASIEQMQQKIQELQQRYQASIILLPFLQLEISSTNIRERINKGKSIRYLVSDEVMSYIEEKGFYQNEGK